jgi:hypothetical protein
MALLPRRRDAVMKFERLIRSAPTGGFRWKVIGDGKLLESGTAETEMAGRRGRD